MESNSISYHVIAHRVRIDGENPAMIPISLSLEHSFSRYPERATGRIERLACNSKIGTDLRVMFPVVELRGAYRYCY